MDKERLEFALIACLIKRPNIWGDLNHELKIKDFEHPLVISIVRLIEKQLRQHRTLSNTRLVSTVYKENIATPEQINDLAQWQSSDNYKTLAKELRQQNILIAVRETLIATLQNIEAEHDPEKAISRAQSKLLNIYEGLGEAEFLNMQDVAEQMHKQQQKLQVGSEEHLLHWNIRGMEQVAGPLELGTLTIIGARPSMGKTAIAAFECMQWSKQEIPGAIFSMEQDAMQLGERWASALYDIPAEMFLKKLDKVDFDKFQSALSHLNSLPIMVSEKRGLSIDQICSRARMAKMKNPGMKWVLVDYLTLIATSGYGNRTNEIGDIVRKLRDLSKEIDVALLLVAQLSRGVDGRENKRPVMSDLRDSGNIEEYADRVLFLYREGYYKNGFLGSEVGNQITEVAVAKNRRGAIGKKLVTRFNNTYMRWEMLEEPFLSKYTSYLAAQ